MEYTEISEFDFLLKKYKEEIKLSKKYIKEKRKEIWKIRCKKYFNKNIFGKLFHTIVNTFHKIKTIISCRIKVLKSELTAKLVIGLLLGLVGAGSIFIAYTTDDDVEIFINLITGSLIIVIGFGLFMLDLSEKREESKDSINVFIGQELFKKGLHGILIGVLVGSLKLIM
ncbi:MAG: hypothetical protein ABS913_01490 [Desemzia incerta]|uniref:hypothetical protein n=1 Tax=Desemzia incerta TaxID=82801 RepID=UPI003314BE12